MAITSILNARPNTLLFSNRIRNFDGIKHPVYFRPSSQFLKGRSFGFMNSNSTSISISISNSTSKKVAAIPSITNFVNSRAKENPVCKALAKAQKHLRIPVLSLLLTIMVLYGGRQSALACSVGVMGGHLFPSLTFSLGFFLSSFCLFSQYLKQRHKQFFESEAVIIVGILVVACIMDFINHLRNRKNVMKFQLGLLVDGESLQEDLNQIAKTTNTSTSDGWSRILKETTTSLLHHDKHWISSYSSLNVDKKSVVAEERFRRLSREEQGKFGLATLVNLDDMEKESMNRIQEANKSHNTYMVVTILVAATQMLSKPNLPTIVNRGDVEKTLKELRSVSENSKILAVNVFWTPQEKNDMLSMEEYERNYPHLRPFSTPS